MKYDVNLTFEGDPAVAAQWAGFAKKKAREFGHYCERNGQTFGIKWYDITPDVRLKVRYANGIQKAHIIASGDLYGVAFWAITDSYPDGWGETYTALNRPMGTAGGDRAQTIATKNLRLVRGDTYREKLDLFGKQHGVYDPIGQVYFRLQFGGVVCQDANGKHAITVHRHERTTRYRGADGSTSGYRQDFCVGGVAYKTEKYCHGAFRFNGQLFAVLHNGTLEPSHPAGIDRQFATGSTLEVYLVDDIYSPLTWGSVGSVSVVGYGMADEFPGVFKMSDSGALGVGLFHDVYVSGDSSNPRVRPIYLQMSYDADLNQYSATFSVQAAHYIKNVPMTFVDDANVPLYPDDTSLVGGCPATIETEWTRTRSEVPDTSAGPCRRLLAYDVAVVGGQETIVCAWLTPSALHSSVSVETYVGTNATLRWKAWRDAEIDQVLCPAPVDLDPITESVTTQIVSNPSSDIVIYTDTGLSGSLTELTRYENLPITRTGEIYGGRYTYNMAYEVQYTGTDGYEFTVYPEMSFPYEVATLDVIDLARGLFTLATYVGNWTISSIDATVPVTVTQKYLKHSYTDLSWQIGAGKVIAGTIDIPTRSLSGSTLPSAYVQQYPATLYGAQGGSRNFLGGPPVICASRIPTILTELPYPLADNIPLVDYDPSYEPYRLYSLDGANIAVHKEVGHYMGVDTVTAEPIEMKNLGIV